MDKQSIIKKLWEKGVIISADVLDDLFSVFDNIESVLEFVDKNNIKIINKQTIKQIISKDEKKIERTTIKRIDIKSSNKKKITADKKPKTSRKPVSINILKYLKKESFVETKDKITIKNTQEIVIEKEKLKEILEASSQVDENIDKNEDLNSKTTSNSVLIILNKKRDISEEVETNVKIDVKFDTHSYEITIPLWAGYFRRRLELLKRELKKHSNLKTLYNTKNIPYDEENYYIAGLIYEKRPVKNGVIYVIEDSYGKLKVYVPKDVEHFNDVPLDAVVAFGGKYIKDKNLFIAQEIVFPDIPHKNIKTLDIEEDIWVAFTGDFQIGNRFFLRKEFERFIKWIKGEFGNSKQRELARKVAYIAITGDLIDGVGIYPYQENELEIKTAEEQYRALEEYLLQIPETKQVIIIPGNHDVVRLAEPQPPIPKEYLPETYELDNFYYTSNPSYVTIHKGYKILMYHGYSFDWFVSEIPYIRENGGYENPGNIMKFILMIRHLSPTHGAIPYVPYPDTDPLFIKEIPDAFVSGHIHRTFYGIYKGTELINASCFQDITEYQKEMGHIPDPGKVILRNLRTGEVKIISFRDSSVKEIGKRN